MLIKYNFPITTSLFLAESWPLYIGGLTIEFAPSKGHAKKISVTVPASTCDRPPTIRESKEPGIKQEINLGRASRLEEIRSTLIKAQATLHLVLALDIDFDSVEIEWIGETDDEKDQIRVNKYSRKSIKDDPYQPHELGFDLISRAFSTLDHPDNYDMALSFLRRAKKDLHAERYYECFYNLFFFLETKFAPGYSDPQKVIKQFKGTVDLVSSISEIKSNLTKKMKIEPSVVFLVQKTTDELIEHFVKLRGNLHHHAMRRPGIWHPEKADSIKAECLFLLDVAQNLAMREVMPRLFSPQADRYVFDMADKAGAQLTVIVVVEREVDGSIVKERFPFKYPTLLMDRRAVDHINKELRKRVSPVGLQKYTVWSSDEKIVYASYTVKNVNSANVTGNQ